VLLDPGELIPRSRKDERFDEVVEEIASLEKELEGELKKFERTLGFVLAISIKSDSDCRYRLKLGYWHSAVGNKVMFVQSSPRIFF